MVASDDNYLASTGRDTAGAMRRHNVIPPAPRAPLRAMAARAMAMRAVRRLPFRIAVPGSESGDTHEGKPVLRLRRPGEFYQRLGAQGLIGFGEGFQVGDWDTDDLSGLLTVFAAGLDVLIPPWLQGIRGHRAAPRRPHAEKQTVDGARRNSTHHYALPDELFRAFLDETMCYSSAIFPTTKDGRVIAEESTLADAQRTKIDRLLDLADVHEGSRVLEIGTGWGELAVRAAQRGAQVHAVTNMSEHGEFARERASRAAVSERVRVDVRDYRELAAESATYDSILSVEMIEAVGRDYWPAYFQVLERLLAPRGRIGLQAMSMRHDRMMRTSVTYTWIDKYIFPGGLIPSVEAIEQTLARHTGLRIQQADSFGVHFRATLALWRTTFARNWKSVAELGFDEVFRRTWDFYLASSEAGFAANYLDVHQFLIAR